MSFFFCKDVLKSKYGNFQKIYFREAAKMSKLLKKGDFIIIFAVALLSAVSFGEVFLSGGGGETVVITKNGNTVYEGSLYYNKTVRLNGNTVVIKNGAVKMEKADCKNQICVKTGEIRKKGESIICLPGRVTAEIR